MILRIKEFAVIEDGSPDTVVNLVPVTEGPEGSAVFGVSNEHNTDFKIGDGQTYIDRANPSFNIAVLRPDSSDVTQLETWAANQTEVYVSALTLDGGFMFGDKETTTGAIKIRTNQTLSDNDVYVFEVTRETTPGFDPATGLHQSGFWAGENLIGGYEWADADGDGFADGWTDDGDFTSNSFSSGQQVLEAGTTNAQLQRGIYFPFEGNQITFSLSIDSLGTFNIADMLLRFYDSSDSLIQSTTEAISGTIRESVTATAPSNAVIARCLISLSTSSGTSSITISDPSLKLGTDSTYSKF